MINIVPFERKIIILYLIVYAYFILNISTCIMSKCLNCGTESGGKFCPECGQEMEVKRLKVKTIFHDVTHGILHWENSILKTFKQVLLYPGVSAKNYISGLRKSYVKPFSYFIFIQTVYVVIFHWMSGKYFAFVSYNMTYSDNMKDKMEQIQHLVSANINYFNYFMPLSFALFFYLFFRKRTGINYAESIATSFYWMGTTLVFGIVLMLLSFINIRIWDARMIVNLIFLTFAIIQFTGLPKIKGIFKSFLVVILSYFTFIVFVFVILFLYFYLKNPPQ